MKIETSVSPEMATMIRVAAKRRKVSEAEIIRRALGKYFGVSAELKPVRKLPAPRGIDIPDGVVAG